MARQNYQFEKHQREMAKKKKKEEKRRRKEESKKAEGDTPGTPSESAPTVE